MTISAPRAITPSLIPKKYDLANITWSDLGSSTKRPLIMCGDRKTTIAYDTSTQFILYISVNADSAAPTWISMRKSFSGRLFSMVLELANGELLIANNALNGPSTMYVTSGWPAAQAAGYTNTSLDAITYTAVLTAVGGNPTPPYSSHFAATGTDGTVVIAESGSQTTTARAADPFTQGATRVWISRNNGNTWVQIFDPYDYGVAQGMATNVNTGLHMHGVGYDQQNNRVIACYGDDTGSARTVAGAGNAEAVFLDFDSNNNLTATTKVPLDAAYSGYSSGQFIVCVPLANAYVFTSDVSSPQAIQIAPRTGYRTLGAWRNGPTQQYGGVNGRVTGLKTPGMPVFFPGQGTRGSNLNGNTMQWTIGVTDDGGLTFSTIARDVPAQTPAITSWGVTQVLGPYLSGRVILTTNMYANNDNTKTSIVADLVYPGA